MTIICGIDPGKSGGFAVFNHSQRLVEAGRLRFDDPSDLHEALRVWGVEEVIIERAQAAPRQGVSTAFEYGRAFGRTEAICLLTDAAIWYVAPAWWKGRLRVPTDKEKARQIALDRISGMSEFVTRKSDDGVAEAALMAQILFDGALRSELVKNSEKRERRKKRKKPQFRI